MNCSMGQARGIGDGAQLASLKSLEIIYRSRDVVLSIKAPMRLDEKFGW